MTYHLDIDYIKQLKKRKSPFVFIGNPIEEQSIYTILVDNYEAGYKGTEYLIKLGHKNIAFIEGSSESWDAEERLKGYKDAIQDYSLSINDIYIKNGEFIKERGYDLTIELLNLNNPPSAVFAANDRMAIGACNAAHDLGVNVPDELSILGVDDIEAGMHVVPPLTTIKQPSRQMGKKAVEILLQLLNDRAPKKRKIMLSTELVERKTCASYK